MRKPISFGSAGIELVSSLEESAGQPAPDTPFRLCILGDFSGRSSRGIVEPLEGRTVIPVDRDTLDEVIAALGVKNRLESAGTSLEVTFSSLDDFHPDHLMNRVDVFRAVKEIRAGLGDPRTFGAALEVLKEVMGVKGREDASGRVRGKAVPPGDSLLDEMVGEATEDRAQAAFAGDRSDLDAFLKSIVRPHLVPGEDPEQERLASMLDRTLSDLMGEVMHHVSFQALEASWRGVQFLVSRVETDESLRICLVDVSKEELADDLEGRGDLPLTGLYGLLVKRTGEGPFSLVIGDYTFGHEDAGMLVRLAGVAAAAGAPFIAGADPCLVGCTSLEGAPGPDAWRIFPGRHALSAWDDLRHLPEAAYIGLAMPRFLLRLPFGRDTDAVETFPFEEMPEGSVHGHYLWGNPAYACACLLAQSFSSRRWAMRPGDVQDVENLPLHVFRVRGSSAIKPCAEVLLTEKAVDALLDAGIMPLATLKDTDTARLVRFQSIAEPPKGLAGRWNG